MVTGKIQTRAKNTPGGGGTKTLGKKIGSNFLINEIPIVGPIIASKTLLVYRELKGDIMSPEGVLMLVVAFICDLISFIPIIGPIISSAIIGTWFFIRSSGLAGGSKAE